MLLPQPPGLLAEGGALRRHCRTERCQGKAMAAALLCQNKMMCVGVTLLLRNEQREKSEDESRAGALPLSAKAGE